MNKLIVSLVSFSVMSACSVNYQTDDTNSQPPQQVQNHIEANQPSTPEEKAKLAKEVQEMEKISQIKCQDAKLDLVEAEATNDIGIINQVMKRIQKYCKS